MIKLNYNVGFNEATSTFTASFNDAIISGVLGTSTNRVMIGVNVAAPKYQIIYANNSSGALKKYCEADLIN